MSTRCISHRTQHQFVTQIFSEKDVSEGMARSTFHATAVVVIHDGEPQGGFNQDRAKLIPKQRVGRYPLSEL